MSNYENSLSQGVGSILNGISGFFHIFDLPFFVSGILISSTVSIYTLNTSKFDPPDTPFPDWLIWILFFVLTYVIGLVAFAIGRWVNDKWFRKNVLDKDFRDLINNHNLNKKDFVKTYDKNDNWELYARLWQELVHSKDNSLAIKHLSRYWALSALFDGVAISFFTISVLTFVSNYSWFFEPIFSSKLNWTLTISFFLLFILSLGQGAKYYKYQIADLIATIATIKNKEVPEKED